jgi:hypothetical protein
MGWAAVTHKGTITEVLAALILQGNVPLKAVALVGEAIAVDARLSDYDQTAKRATLERWQSLGEAYEALFGRTQSAVDDFSRTPERICAHSESKRDQGEFGRLIAFAVFQAMFMNCRTEVVLPQSCR